MIAPQLDFRLEMLLVAFADEAVDPVRGDDQIGILELFEIGDLAREVKLDAELAATRVQNQQQRAALGAAEAVAGRSNHFAVEVEVDLVPIGEFARDGLVGRRVVIHQIVERLVGEHHAEAERIVRPVPLVNGDVVVRISFLHQQGEIEPAGTAADDDDFHAASFVRSRRDRSLRPTPSYKSSTRSNHAATTSASSSTFAGETTRAHCRSPNKI